MIFTIGARSRAARTERVYMRGVHATVGGAATFRNGTPVREDGMPEPHRTRCGTRGRTSGFRARTEKG